MEQAGSEAAIRARAAEAVAACAERAGVVVRMLTGGPEYEAAAELFTAVWQAPSVPEHILRVLGLSGNYVAGAFDEGGRLVGASVAFACIFEEPELHSHITGVAMSHRHSGVGVVLKLHQRSWALEHGIGLINWTFDPLIKRNANFNLARLGATAVDYLVNVYGIMHDALNGRDESDRLLVRWRLADREVEAAAAGFPRRVKSPPGTVERLKPGPDGHPVVRSAREGDAPAFTCRVPDDMESLRSSDPELASAWRVALREVLGRPLAAGAQLLGLNEEGDYVVAGPPGAP